MNKIIFKGAATAIITPFRDGEIDFEAFGKLIDWQIENGISAIVVCGTTGEASAMSTCEQLKCIEFAVERADRRIPIVAGSGSNCTKKSIYLSQKASELGADGLLVITPYYNKTSRDGLIKHFTEIADSVDKPILLYNVPSRTGMSIPLDVYQTLAEHKNIVGVKEASGNLSEIAMLSAVCGDKLAIYSGNDDQILPILSLGGIGVISVASNIVPKSIQAVCDSFFSSELLGARKIQLELMDLISALFCEVNPIPIKHAMGLVGFCASEIRAPLTYPSEKSALRIREALKKHGLI